MKISRIIIFALVVLLYKGINAQHGDTITVQTFTYGSPQDAWFVFPSDTIRYEKILMQYTLKCNPAMSPACGEWDYLTYSYLYDHTGLLDSSVVHQPVFTVNGNTTDTLYYSNSPTYNYNQNYQYFIVHSDTTAWNVFTVGTNQANSNHPFALSAPISRAHYLWRASELSAAGISAGDITGLQFYFQTNGSTLHDLTIRFKNTTTDSLNKQMMINTGFQQVYSLTTNFLATGWQSLQFTNPFTWDGSSNILIEITYDNTAPATSHVIAVDSTNFVSGLENASAD